MAKSRKDDLDPNAELTGRLLHALNHPIRLRILEHLMRENASATILTDVFGMKLSNVSYHLCKVLYEECGVVAVVEEIQRRGVMEKVFQIKREAYVGVLQWQRIPEPIRSGARGIALERFLSMAIEALQAEGEEARDDSVYSWQGLEVDEQGQREVDRAFKDMSRRLDRIEKRSIARSKSRLVRLVTGWAAFRPAPIPGDHKRI